MAIELAAFRSAVSEIKARDLDKALVVSGEQKDRVGLAGRKVDLLTPERAQDAIYMRGQLLTALRTSLGGDTSSLYKQAEEYLFGQLGVDHRFVLETASKPLTVRDVKTILRAIDGLEARRAVDATRVRLDAALERMAGSGVSFGSSYTPEQVADLASIVDRFDMPQRPGALSTVAGVSLASMAPAALVRARQIQPKGVLTDKTLWKAFCPTQKFPGKIRPEAFTQMFCTALEAEADNHLSGVARETGKGIDPLRFSCLGMKCREGMRFESAIESLRDPSRRTKMSDFYRPPVAGLEPARLQRYAADPFGLGVRPTIITDFPRSPNMLGTVKGRQGAPIFNSAVFPCGGTAQDKTDYGNRIFADLKAALPVANDVQLAQALSLPTQLSSYIAALEEGLDPSNKLYEYSMEGDTLKVSITSTCHDPHNARIEVSIAPDGRTTVTDFNIDKRNVSEAMVEDLRLNQGFSETEKTLFDSMVDSIRPLFSNTEGSRNGILYGTLQACSVLATGRFLRESTVAGKRDTVGVNDLLSHRAAMRDPAVAKDLARVFALGKNQVDICTYFLEHREEVRAAKPDGGDITYEDLCRHLFHQEPKRDSTTASVFDMGSDLDEMMRGLVKAKIVECDPKLGNQGNEQELSMKEGLTRASMGPLGATLNLDTAVRLQVGKKEHLNIGLQDLLGSQPAYNPHSAALTRERVKHQIVADMSRNGNVITIGTKVFDWRVLRGGDAMAREAVADQMLSAIDELLPTSDPRLRGILGINTTQAGNSLPMAFGLGGDHSGFNFTITVEDGVPKFRGSNVLPGQSAPAVTANWEYSFSPDGYSDLTALSIRS